MHTKVLVLLNGKQRLLGTPTKTKENGSYICNDLLGCDISTDEGKKYAIENNLFVDFCPKMVASAVKIAEQLMNE